MSSEISVDVVPFENVFSGPHVYECPFFQRPFKWKKKNIDKFIADLIQLETDDDDSIEHYLGAIVVRPDPDAPTGLQHPNVWTVIDGQQRLTTAFLTILKLCEMLHAAGVAHEEEAVRDRAAAYVGQYLMLDPTWPRGREPRVLPTARDYSDLLALVDATRANARVVDEAPDRFRFSSTFISPLGDAGGPLWKAYDDLLPKALKKHLEDLAQDPETLERVLTNLLRRMKVIWVIVPPGADPYEIFHNLNAEGQRLTHGELVKVAVFQRFDRANLTAALAAERDWDALVEVLGADAFEAFLFPYALCHEPQAKKRELIPALEGIWKGMGPDEIIRDLREHADLYDLITDPTVEIDDFIASPALAERARAMRESVPPSSTYPYLMLVLQRALADDSYADEAARIFWMVETFLVRRQFQGIEPTGLHTLFKGLWFWEADGVSGQTAEGFRARIETNVNIEWIDDDEFTRAVETKPLYGRRIQRFVIAEFERAHFGDISNDALGTMEVDHVAPQTIAGTPWVDVFPNPEAYKRVVNTWGNLVPLVKTGDVSNSAKGQKTWEEVRTIFLASAFQTAKHLCGEPVWDESAIRRRGKGLAVWALKRWPDSPPKKLPTRAKDTAVDVTQLPLPGESLSTDDVAAVIAAGEGECVEFKSTARVNLTTKERDDAIEHEVGKTICAFMNHRGGALLIGVDDAGNALGLDADLPTLGRKQDLDGLELFLRSFFRDRLEESSASLTIDFPTVDGVTVCRITVPPSSEPRFLKAKKGDKAGSEFWVRAGNRSERLEGREFTDYQKKRWG
jgi:hypothetical protein